MSASDVAARAPSFNNLELSLGSAVVPPFDHADDPTFRLVPLREPIRPLATTYPSAYPRNIYGETPHGAMASQITSLVRQAGGNDWVTVHSVVGENGQGIAMLRKGANEVVSGATSTGRAYAATIFETTAIARLAKTAGKSFGVGAIVVTHGETDSGSPTYEADLVQLWSDYNRDLSAISAQTRPIEMYVSQHHAFGWTAGKRSGIAPSTLVQWKIGLDQPGKIVCSGPKYQYPYASDNVHLVARGYELLGEKYGEIYYERAVLGHAWQPLQPLEAKRAGNVVHVKFHVPVAPLVWDASLPDPHQTALTEWARGRGFELRLGETPLPIRSVSIVNDSIEISAESDVPAGAVVGYAATSDGTQLPGVSRRWGQLHDSDSTVGAVTGVAQPNYAVAFELPLP
jgi:hypothetical protein